MLTPERKHIVANPPHRSSLLVAALLLLLVGCAKQGMPTGGPKDETAPKVVSTRPQNGTNNFNAKEFTIDFDEYVVLKDAENNIIVSPPMAEKPEYKVKGRSLHVKINDTLSQNTTYLFQMINAVADFNEGNLLPYTDFVFSTGNDIDSMTLSGTVLDALSLKASESTVSVWLFPDGYDTIPPTYITRCDPKGNFMFKHIKPGHYSILAVCDENRNLRHNEAEPVAFSTLQYEASTLGDSTTATSSDAQPRPLLRLFKPDENKKQRIVSSNFRQNGKVQITSLLPMTNPSLVIPGEEYVTLLNKSRDTLTFWTLRKECDSLQIVVNDASGINDTILLRNKTSKGRNRQQAESTTLSMTPSHTKQPYFDTLSLTVSTPLDRERCHPDSSLVILALADSTTTCVTPTIDTSLMRLVVDYPFRQGENYQLTLPKGSFSDIYGRENDTLRFDISIDKEEEYASLDIVINGDSTVSDSLLLTQLLDDKDNVVAERQGTAKVLFPHIVPGKYRVRVIVDANANGKWDTGNFAQRQQPEAVTYLDKTLDIRAKWHFEEKITITQ